MYLSLSKLTIHYDGELDVFSKQTLSNCYFERGGLLPRPPPDGWPVLLGPFAGVLLEPFTGVLLGPFTGVLFDMSFSPFVNDADIMIEGLATFGDKI